MDSCILSVEVGHGAVMESGMQLKGGGDLEDLQRGKRLYGKEGFGRSCRVPGPGVVHSEWRRPCTGQAARWGPAPHGLRPVGPRLQPVGTVSNTSALHSQQSLKRGHWGACSSGEQGRRNPGSESACEKMRMVLLGPGWKRCE